LLNQFAVCGILEEAPEWTSSGQYLKLRIRCDDGNGRSALVEAITKEGTWYEVAGEGSTVIVSGKLTGKVNDKGYLNMGLWAFDVHVVDKGTKVANPPFDETADDDVVF
jgi:hypothetical protein